MQDASASSCDFAVETKHIENEELARPLSTFVEEVNAKEKIPSEKINRKHKKEIVFLNCFFIDVFYVEKGRNILCKIAFIFFGFIV